MNLSACHISTNLKKQFSHAKLTSCNIYYRNMWEADFLYVTESGWVNEIEIKVYKHDFIRDLNDKPGKYVRLIRGESGLKRFYYACPENMLQPEDIPNFAGLIYSNGKMTWISKKPVSFKNPWKCDRALTEKIKAQNSRNYLRKFKNQKL